MKEFVTERIERYKKQFIKAVDFTELPLDNVIYMSFLDKYETLSSLTEILKQFKHIKFEFYRDIYHDDLWYFEIFSKNASKNTAVNFLREYLQAEHITVFGDNLNDIPMFNAANTKISVQNARKELKDIADIIIDSNENDAVVQYLNKHLT